MNQIGYIFLLFCTLFLIEKKAINILISFVAIIITTAFIIPIIGNYSFNLSLIIESEYFSYALILVQVSALTILFGFIIMLFPNLAQSNPKTSYLNSQPIIQGVKTTYYKDSQRNDLSTLSVSHGSSLWGLTIITTLIVSLILLGGLTNLTNILEDININLFYETSFNSNLNTLFNKGGDGSIDYEITSFNTMFLRKLGILFYSVEGYIIKLLVLTVILLLAIISLFFIIL
jgi:hypothetical protein